MKDLIMKQFHNTIVSSTTQQKQGATIKLLIALLLSFTLAITPGLAFATEGGSAKEGYQDHGIVEQDTTSERASNEASSNGQSTDAGASDSDEASEEAPSASSSDQADVSDEQSGLITQGITEEQEEDAEAGEIVAQAGEFALKISTPGDLDKIGSKRFDFTVQNATSSNITYRVNSLEVWIDTPYSHSYETQYTNVADSASPYFTFDFRASGKYRLTVTAIEGNNQKQAQAMVEFTINDPSAPKLETLAENIKNNYKGTTGTTDLASDYDKTLYVHDYLIGLNAHEDSSGKYCGASGVLLYSQGSSESYHQAMALILGVMGVKSQRLSADGKVWTLVNVGGSWMHVDAAEDDKRSGDLQHLFFGLTDTQMKRIRSGYTPQSGFTATNANLNYYMRTGNVTKWSNEIKNKIAAQLDAGKTSFTITSPVYSDTAVYDVLCDFVAGSLSNTTISGKQVLVQFVNKGPGSYKSSYYQVTTKSLNSPYMVVSDLKTSYAATGSAITPTPTLTLNGTRLRLNTDYSITYKNNVNPGTATMVITGKNGYTGSITKTFTITATATNPIVATGTWKKSSGKWWFQYDSATRATQGGKTYPASEWVKISGKLYHFDSAGWMNTNWLKLDGSWYYLGSDGAMKTGWQKVKGTWYYMASSGIMQTGKQTISGQTYYLDPTSGAMKTGWNRESSSWYYYKSSGAMAKGWQKVKNKWYYLDTSTGKMKTSWLEVSGQKYFLNTSGAMLTGWVKILDKWYYFNTSGAMAKGWKKVSGSWYYLNTSDGAMKTGFYDVGSTRYYSNSSGKMLTGWQKINNQWYYFSGSGAMQKSKWIGNYYVDSNGVMATNQWIGNYHVNSSGKWDQTR